MKLRGDILLTFNKVKLIVDVCESCGDGVKDGSLEACDDGNLVSADGCDSLCQVEAGYSCDNNDPSVCSPLCGDGRKISPETCDDGPADHSYLSTPKCLDDCSGPEPGYLCTGGSINTPSTCSP